jgi:hypothetical protein
MDANHPAKPYAHLTKEELEALVEQKDRDITRWVEERNEAIREGTGLRRTVKRLEDDLAGVRKVRDLAMSNREQLGTMYDTKVRELREMTDDRDFERRCRDEEKAGRDSVIKDKTRYIEGLHTQLAEASETSKRLQKLVDDKADQLEAVGDYDDLAAQVRDLTEARRRDAIIYDMLNAAFDAMVNLRNAELDR